MVPIGNFRMTYSAHWLQAEKLAAVRRFELMGKIAIRARQSGFMVLGHDQHKERQRQRDRHTQTNSQTGRQAGRQTDIQRQTARQAGKQASR